MKAGQIANFDMILEDAEANANTEWEMGFVADIQAKYDDYEDDMFVSDNQLESLERIAGY